MDASGEDVGAGNALVKTVASPGHRGRVDVAVLIRDIDRLGKSEIGAGRGGGQEKFVHGDVGDLGGNLHPADGQIAFIEIFFAECKGKLINADGIAVVILTDPAGIRVT